MDSFLNTILQSENLLAKQLCPLCSSIVVTPFLYRSRVPVLTNLLLLTQEAAKQIPRGDIHLVACENCGFVFNCAFEPSALYNEGYDNSQAHAPSFERYLDALIHSLVTEQHIQHHRIIEVGCGDGLFLRKLVEASDENTGYGFDPSYQGPLEALQGRLQFETCYYDETCCHISADVLICRHVIEHIPDPLQFLRTLRRALASSPRTRAFFETPSLEWIMRNNVVWDIYYEHCSYFTVDTITLALERSGFKVECIKHTFEEQYLWVEATISDAVSLCTLPAIEPDSLLSLTAQFRRYERQLCEQWKQTLQVLRQDGSVALIGAAGKGVTLANLIDPDCQLISCIVDLNPRKHLKFLPGTGHPIVSYEEMKTYGITSALLMNPNYYNDTLQLLAHYQFHVRLITDHVPTSISAIGSEHENKSAQKLLLTRIEQAQGQGKTIVFTNGVFDLLHSGHIQFLRYAKALGDILVVALDSDMSASQLKGPGRPINNERDRMMLIDALDMVDYVLLFEGEALPELIRAFRPHIYVKGNDYYGKISPALEALQDVGTHCIFAPHRNDLHTSDIIDRILALASGNA